MALEATDIQGNVLRGFGHAHARHFALTVGEPAGGRAQLAALLPGVPPVETQVTSAEHWGESEPDHCLNVGITFLGLKALGVPDPVLATFPTAFQQGSAARSSGKDPDYAKGIGLGDIGAGAPANWILGGEATPPVHILLSVYMRDLPGIERVSGILRAQFAQNGVTEVSCHDGQALGDGIVHFGYVDGIAQPRFSDVGGRQLADMQPESQTGDFLLGRDYSNRYGGNYLGDIPSALGDNATYGAFRIQEQDVHGFEEMLDSCAHASGMDRELVAAKMMGRWRNGVPISVSPDSDTPKPPLGPDELNDFDYVPGPGRRAVHDDAAGLRCPVGSHIRRLNPRGAMAMGIPHSRRILRRSMPYGPRFDPDAPTGDERGLIGYFMCGDLEMQFEFIQRVWVNQDISTAGLRGTREPIIGTQPEGGGKFTIRTTDARDPIELTGLPNLVVTRGSLYCMLPGIGGLRHLAGMA